MIFNIVNKPILLFFGILLQASCHAGGLVIGFSGSDFSTTTVKSSVTTFDIMIDVSGPLQTGLVTDPVLDNIQYSISGSLTATPSGFPAFAFRLDHKFPSSPPITGAEFYALNASSATNGTLQYFIDPFADLSDGVQATELQVLTPDPTAGIGSNVIFHLNAREEGSGRYHPLIIQLYDDGTGLLQNADNMGGINPATMEEVNVDFGEEYITNLSFTPENLTIALPAPPHITAASYSTNGILHLTWNSRSNAVYSVELSDDLDFTVTTQLFDSVFSQGDSTTLVSPASLADTNSLLILREAPFLLLP